MKLSPFAKDALVKQSLQVPPLERGRIDLWSELNEELFRKKGTDVFDQKCYLMNEFRKKKISCDVVLVASDGTEFPAHKIVLMGFSEYFFLIFTNEFLEKDQSRIEFKETDSGNLKIILEYAYTSDVDITKDNVQMLLESSCYFRIGSLKERCCTFLYSTIINVDNAFTVGELASRFSCKKLLSLSKSYVERNFSEIVKSEIFLDLSLETVMQLIKSDGINVANEKIVYDSVIKWVKHDLNNRKAHLTTLISSVRLPFVGLLTLIDVVLQEPLFEKNFDCLSLIKNAIKSVREYGDNICDFLAPRTSYFLLPMVLVIGGKNPAESALNTVARFDFSTKRWTSMANMLNAVYGCAAVAANGKIYVFGGYDDNSVECDCVQVYNIYDDSWSMGTTMAIPRAYAGAVFMDNKIFVIGGEFINEDSLSQELETEYYLCLQTNLWSSIKSMHQKRTAHSVAVLHGFIYTIGGFWRPDPDYVSCEFLDSVERYDVKANLWHTVSPMNYKRAYASSLVFNEKLFVVGGSDGDDYLNSAECYDPVTNSWSSIASMMQPRFEAGIFCDQRCIYVVGGGNSDTYGLNTMERYDLETNTWIRCSESMVTGRYAFGLAVTYTYRSNH